MAKERNLQLNQGKYKSVVKEVYKTYEQRHDDPTGFSFKPTITKFNKEIFANSPRNMQRSTKSAILRTEESKKQLQVS